MTFTCPTTMSNTVKQALLDQELSIVITSSISCTIEEFMSWNHRTYVVNLQEVNLARKSRRTRRKNVGEASKHSDKVSQSFLVSLEVPSVSEIRRDDKYVLRTLNSLKSSEKNKWSRTALSFILNTTFVWNEKLSTRLCRGRTVGKNTYNNNNNNKKRPLFTIKNIH